ncbi:MAG TPA: hypothetical protein VNY05_32345 [Candidatus Acidoferrales bacterium]|nr:hypothetical protein [Candidatus Acidoferrales bacterium]
MIPSHRQWFNRSYSEAKYQRFLALLAGRFGEPTPFRHSETPVFLPATLVGKMARYGREMVDQLLADPQYQQASRDAVPAQFCVPDEAAEPLFVQADFGLDAAGEPKLVEIQGFPSLYAYQPVVAECYREAYGIDEVPAAGMDAGLATLPGGLSLPEYHRLLGEAILGGHDPRNVILLEIDPSHQKTRHDFLMTERLFGVRAVDIATLRKQADRLYYNRDGTLTPVHRIYNRTIVDELLRRQIPLAFDFRDDLDVEWAGHPNWFFRLSKFSLPFLKHPAVPRTQWVAPVEHPERWVLKPLFGFAGAGVIVGPTAAQIAAVAEGEAPGDYVLQERVDFQPVIATPFGPTKIEVRIMYIGRQAVNTVIRMGRGAQMGVDHNKGFDWVGATAAFIDPS